MNDMSYEEIFKEFCEYNEDYVGKIVNYKPWGSTSILIELTSGMSFKVKRYAANKFIMQLVSKEDIDRKYNRIK